MTLRNRVIKAATYEGMTPSGMPSPALIEHHRALAAGGVGMTTVAYCAVSPEGRTFGDQMVMSEKVVEPLQSLVGAVHAEGAAVCLQLAHCGFFTRHRSTSARGPRGPSFAFNSYGVASGLLFARAMDAGDIQRAVDDFAAAAAIASKAGFDAVELHLGHGYLLSQFISPATNRRRDRYGGPLQYRMRLPLEVVEAVKASIPGSMAVLAKTNLSDGFRSGLQIDESIEVARMLQAAGIDGIVLSGGFTSRSAFYLLRGGRPLKRMREVEANPLQRLAMTVLGPFVVKPYPFEELFFLPLARRVREAVQLPLALLGGVVSLDNLSEAMREGFDFVAMGRALIADPDLIARMQSGDAERSRCNACNECVAEMDAGGIRCVLDEASA